MKSIALPNARCAFARHSLSVLAWVIASMANAAAQDALPQRDDREPLDFEAQLQLDDVKP